MQVDAAQRALLAAVPKPRDDGVPLAQAIAGFTTALEEATRAMPGWRAPMVEQIWLSCESALAEAGMEATKLRLRPSGLSFEALNEAIGDVLAPLEAFVDADGSLRRL